MAWNNWLIGLRYWDCLRKTRQDLKNIDPLILHDLGLDENLLEDMAQTMASRSHAQPPAPREIKTQWAPAKSALASQ